MLESLGYALLDTGMPSEALQFSKIRGCNIALLLTDVVMPEMNGLELAEKVKQCCPSLCRTIQSMRASTAVFWTSG